MKKVYSKLIFFFFSLFLILNLNAKEEMKLNVGVLENYELFLGFKGNKKSLSKWFKQFSEPRGVNMQITFYKEIKDVYKDFLNNKLDFAFLPTKFFFEKEKSLKKKTLNYYGISFREESLVEYCIFVNKDRKEESFKNKSISLLKNDDISYHWIDKITLEKYKKNANKVFKKILYKQKESTVLLNVYFKKVDFGVVKKATFLTMKDLNPSLSKNIEIKNCFDGLLVAYIGFSSKMANKKVINLLLNFLGRKETGQDVEDFFNIIPFNHLFEIESKDLIKMRNFFKEYKKLHKKYE